MNKNTLIHPPTTLFLMETNTTNTNHLPLYQLTNIKGKVDGELNIGEVFTDIEIDDLVELGFNIKLLSKN